MKKLFSLIICVLSTYLSLAQILISSNNTQPSCNSSCNGSTTFSISGGLAPYNCTVTTTGMTYTTSSILQLTNLCSGTYGLMVADQSSATATASVTITSYPGISVATSQTNSACGQCTGVISTTVMGGSPPYQYTLHNMSGPINTTSVAQNLCPGTYSLLVTDGMGCVGFAAIFITNTGTSSLSGVTTTLSVYNEDCVNTGNGAVDLMVGGSNPGPFTYQWNTGATTEDINNVVSGVYSVTIFDGAMNCITVSDSVKANGINCGTINGNVFIDNNSDCIKNFGDGDFQNAMVVMNPGNRYAYTNTMGAYNINNVPYGSYTLTLISYNSVINSTCNNTLTPSVNASVPNSINNNFSVGYNSTTSPDIVVQGHSNGIVPGFVCRMYYQLYNNNNVAGTGLFKAVLPASFIPAITGASPVTYTISADTLIWNYTNVTYTGGGRSFYVDFTVPLNTPLGSLFNSCMYAHNSTTDFNPVNNTYCYQRTVTGSFDPNDKGVNPMGIGPAGNILPSENELTYLIRFQNTGNGPAVNIVVKDTLSPNVDVTTFEMLSASHNYNIDVMSGNVLRWTFNNIMLADSNSNEPASHGYIQYRIKRTNNNTLGTEIKNTAYIYFDFNEPVVTNTTLNTIAITTGINALTQTDNNWLVYPNPTAGELHVTKTDFSNSEKTHIQIINTLGQTILETNMASAKKVIDMSGLQNGIYMIRLTSGNSTAVKQIVLKR